MARHGEFIPSVRAEIRRLGGAIDRERRGRHFVIYWSIDVRKVVTVVPLTTVNSRTLDNLLAQIRRSARRVAA
jgi:hypothetical protein